MPVLGLKGAVRRSSVTHAVESKLGKGLGSSLLVNEIGVALVGMVGVVRKTGSMVV